MSDSIEKKFKPWLILSLAILVASLLLLAVVGTVAFVSEEKIPVWLILLGLVAALGIALGFGGFFLIMLTGGLQSFRESRRVQVIPPPREPDHAHTK